MRLATGQVVQSACILGVLMAISIPASAELQITEVHYASNWAWIEVRNNDSKPIDLDGFVLDDDDGAPLDDANILKEMPKQNTVIPPNGVAVLFSADTPELTAKHFRESWKVPSKAQLIGVNLFPGLSKRGDQFGLWVDFETYTSERLSSAGVASRSVGFDKALVSIKYGEPPTPSPSSIAWNGNGKSSDLNNWITITNAHGAHTSQPIALPRQLNSTDDIGNPGQVTGKTSRRGLFITEIMYNPNSEPDSVWEYVELINQTGLELDFSKSPFVVDDLSGEPISSPNLTSGTVRNGELFVLFNAEQQSVKGMQDAWGADIKFLPVEDFPTLKNSGDTVALWGDFRKYTKDKSAENVNNVVVAVSYLDGKARKGEKTKWPKDDGRASIHLDLSLYPTRASSWALSSPSDGLSRTSKASIKVTKLYSGGDMGTPGSFEIQK